MKKIKQLFTKFHNFWKGEEGKEIFPIIFPFLSLLLNLKKRNYEYKIKESQVFIQEIPRLYKIEKSKIFKFLLFLCFSWLFLQKVWLPDFIEIYFGGADLNEIKFYYVVKSSNVIIYVFLVIFCFYKAIIRIIFFKKIVYNRSINKTFIVLNIAKSFAIVVVGGFFGIRGMNEFDDICTKSGYKPPFQWAFDKLSWYNHDGYITKRTGTENFDHLEYFTAHSNMFFRFLRKGQEYTTSVRKELNEIYEARQKAQKVKDNSAEETNKNK